MIISSLRTNRTNVLHSRSQTPFHRLYFSRISSPRHPCLPIHGTFSLNTNLRHDVSSSSSSSLFSNIPILSNKELMQRISVSFLAISIYRIGHYIQTPGIITSLSNPLSPLSPPPTPTSFTDFISGGGGGGEVFGNILALSIGPLMETYLAFGLLNIIPEIKQHMAALQEEGEMGRRQVKKYVNTLFIFFALFDAYRASNGYLTISCTASAASASASASAVTTTLFSSVISFITERLPIMITLLAGATICKYLVQWVDAQGLGEGAGLFIGYSIALQYSKHLSTMIPILLEHTPPLLNMVMSGAVVVGLVMFVVLLQRYEYRVPLTFYRSRQARSVVDHPAFQMLQQRNESRDGNGGGGGGSNREKKGEKSWVNTHGNNPTLAGDDKDDDGVSGRLADEDNKGLKTHLPFKLSPNGARQLLFVNFWISLLEIPLNKLGLAYLLHSPLVFAGLVFFMESLSVGDTTSRQLSQYVALSNAGIIGHSPGAETEKLIASIKTRLKLVNATLLACLSLVAHLVDVLTASLLGGVPVGCLNILLLTSTVLGVARQWDALGRMPAVAAMIEKQRRVLESATATSGSGGIESGSASSRAY